MFKLWYKELKFSQFAEECASSDENIWQFKVVYFYPCTYVWEKDRPVHLKKLRSALIQFYKGIFDSNKDDKQAISESVDRDPLIIFLAFRGYAWKADSLKTQHGLRRTKMFPYSNPLWGRRKQLPCIVVGAITTRMLIETDPPQEVCQQHACSVFIVWFAAQFSKTHVPPELISWHQQGFGVFLLF